MKWLFICNNCGRIFTNIDSSPDKIVKCRVLHKCECSEMISMDNAYPSIPAAGLIRTLVDLKEECKSIDRDNRNRIIDFLHECEINMDSSTVDSYINIYEKIKQKYIYGDTSNYIKITDEFEENLLDTDLTDYVIDSLNAALSVYNSNNYRKLIIISLASLIEILFYDCFNSLIKLRLGEYGGKLFLKQYENAGIQNCIDIISSFMANNITVEMNLHSNDFSNKWLELRRLRNSITHSNDKYISKVKLNKYYKLLEASITVFSLIKSKIIKNEI